MLAGRLNPVKRERILVVEDEPDILEVIRHNLAREGFRVTPSRDGEQGLESARKEAPDLILLDLMLPGLDGLGLCRRLRRQSSLPILFLSARGTEDDTVAGLEEGADDYVAKPFSPRELMARVHALLRRAGAAGAGAVARDADARAAADLIVGALHLDPPRRQARLDGQALQLTPREFDLLSCLAAQPGRVFGRGDLIAQVWGLDYEGMERTVDVHVMNLRRKVEALPGGQGLIRTVFGVGYALREAGA